MSTEWRVYPSAPPTVTCRTRREARALAGRYARLGMISLLYEADGDDWVKRERISAPDRSSPLWRRVLWGLQGGGR